MSRKSAVKAPPAPSRSRAESLLRSGLVLDAVKTIREVCARAPTEENHDFQKQILTGAADALLDSQKPIDEILAAADALTPADPNWIRTRAGWLARSGQFAAALSRIAVLNDHNDVIRLSHLTADQSVRLKSKAPLPAEFHEGHAAIMAAFQHYEAGEDDRSREALQPVGLQSPFLDWKVFLRGLIACANEDHTRAIENWDRLDNTRLAHRLAAPMRFAIDPGFRDSQTELARDDLRRRGERLNAGKILDGLRSVRQHLGRDKALAAAYREAGPVVPVLLKTAPDLVPRLAACFYYAILHHGKPEDLARHRNLFGSPADDPHFDKLEACIFEQMDQFADANRHWQKYEGWLATNPPGWPADVAARARAIVWFRLATNAREDSQRDFGPMSMVLSEPLRMPKRKPLKPDTIECLRRAMDMAPDWGEPPLRLVQTLVEEKKPAEAEAAARQHLARKPDDLPVLRELAEILENTDQFEQSKPVWLQALALQPLDLELRYRASFAILGVARQRSMKVDPGELRAELDQHRSILEGGLHSDYLGLEYTLAAKQGADDAADLLERALARPNERLAMPCRLVVEATLAGLKPAQKSQATKRFKAAMQVPAPNPMEVASLIHLLHRYMTGGFKYRGQKTHEKQAAALIPRCFDAEHPVRDFMNLALLLESLGFWKELLACAEMCSRRFPREPVFPYQEALAMVERDDRLHIARQRLDVAKNLAKGLKPEDQRSMMNKIEDLEQELSAPFGFLDSFFEMFNG